MPPSSDGLAKPAPRSLRRKSGASRAVSLVIRGSTLSQMVVPDEVVWHETSACGGCDGGLADAPLVGVERRQEFDLLPIRIRVIEHQLVARWCACGATTCADAPAGLDALVQYGPRVAAIIAYLYIGQFLSKKRTAQALAELFGTPVLAGIVATVTRRDNAGLDGFPALVRGKIDQASVANFDETRLRVAGQAALGALGVDLEVLTDHRAPTSVATPGWTPLESCPTTPVSRCMTRGHRMASTARPPTPCATRSGARGHVVAGPIRPLRRCGSWPNRPPGASAATIAANQASPTPQQD